MKCEKVEPRIKGERNGHQLFPCLDPTFRKSDATQNIYVFSVFSVVKMDFSVVPVSPR